MKTINTTDPQKYLYFARIEHPFEAVSSESVLDFCASVGVPVRSIVMNLDGSSRSELGHCLDDAIAIASFNWHLDHSCIGDRIFLDVAAEAGVPVIQWFVDHPSALWPDFVYSTAENSRFLFQSSYQESYFRKFIMPDCRSGCTAATGPNRSSRLRELTLASFQARDFACLVPLNLRRIAGTLEKIEQKRTALPDALRGLVTEAIESAYTDLELPIESHLLSISPSGLVEESGRLHHCIQIIAETVQIRRRLLVFEVAQEFPVLLQSDIASSYLRGDGRAVLEEGVSMWETLRRMPRSRSVLSLTPVNDQLHDRTLNGLNAGALNIIEDNKLHREIFAHGENALLFRYDDDSLREALALVCSDPKTAYRIAEAGFALRDDPRLRFGGFNNFLELAR
jgi:hypothetical protein